MSQAGQDDIRAAARLLATKLNAHSIARAISEESNAMRHEDEDKKHHPMRLFRLSDKDWADFCAYMRDGGGVFDTSLPSKDGRHLDQIMHDAVMNGDQETFMNEWPHWLKAHWAKIGRVRRLPGGGVASGPHGISEGKAV
jgi:hypothetical protein